MPPLLIAGGIAAAGSIGGALISSSASKNAAQTAANANSQASQLQQHIFDTTQQNLSPYIGAGNTATNALLAGLGLGGGFSGQAGGGFAGNVTQTVNGHPVTVSGAPPTNPAPGTEWINPANPNQLEVWDGSEQRWGAPNAAQTTIYLGSATPGSLVQQASGTGTSGAGGSFLNSPLLAPFSMTQGALEQTPGYQFNLTQNLKAVQNAAAARGLGVSGAALKGAANYATGLADNTFQTQMNNYYTGQQNQYNRLMGLVGTGESAAAGQGTIGAQTGSAIGQTTVGAGNALAAGQVGSANALAGGLGNLSNLYLMNNLYGGALFGGGGGGGMYGGGGGSPVSESSFLAANGWS